MQMYTSEREDKLSRNSGCRRFVLVY